MKIYGACRRTHRGNFDALLRRPEFAASLFVFNDNEREHATAKRGWGNASVRPWNRHGTASSFPRTHGIPTGVYRTGYARLDAHARRAIDGALEELQALLTAHPGRYESIVYSTQAEDDPLLGTGLFVVSSDVRKYITTRILALGDTFQVVDDGTLKQGVVFQSADIRGLLP